jgi:DNA segregation ATPase FtsK/SpoIIIE, S-DNA-T family
LHGVLASNTFRKLHSPLRIALGRDVSGEPVVADLAAMPHLLLAGTTGSGKSVCLNAIIASLLFNNTPNQLRMILVDPKRVEMSKYNGVPHLLAPVVTEIEQVIVALRWVTREMERRYAQFATVGARNLEGYNKLAKSKQIEPLPMIVVVVDELADLMMAAPDDVERTLCRLAQMARATGIHLVIATQRPSVDVVTGLIKANFPARISFAVTSQIDSRVILDVPGAEKLLGRGDMLFMAPDSPKLQRIQGCFVSDTELEALVAFCRDNAREEPDATPQPAPWEEMTLEEEGSDDALIQQATELVRNHSQASASFLQRQMRIGYPRAARLIDQLEKMGIVGPPEVGGRSRTVLDVPEGSDAESAPLSEEGEGS